MSGKMANKHRVTKEELLIAQNMIMDAATPTNGRYMMDAEGNILQTPSVEIKPAKKWCRQHAGLKNDGYRNPVEWNNCNCKDKNV